MSEHYSIAPSYGEPLRVQGIQVHDVGVNEVHAYIEKMSKSREKALVLNVNIHCMNLAHKLPWLKDFLNSAQMVFCDGDGVRWGLMMLGIKPPPKITYDRWMWQLGEFCQEKGLSLYFIGGQEGVTAKAAENMKAKFPNLNIAGTTHGYFKKEGPENDAVIAKINEAKPDILITGFGMPIQEKWLIANWENIDAHIFLTGGAAFDYVAGHARRAPQWMLDNNMEWLFRLTEEPKRLFMRYVWGNPYFLFRVFCEKIAGILCPRKK